MIEKTKSFMESLQGKKVFKIIFVFLLVSATVFTAKNAVESVFNEYKNTEITQNTTPQQRVSKSQTKDGKKKLPIYCVDTPEKKVAISFDAAWGADDTDTLLQILKEYDVKATFFLCGYWVDKYPEEIKRISADGHDIGNHGNTHAHSSQLTKEKNKEEILAVNEKIKNLLGKDVTLFRPPFGEYNDTVIDAADELGIYTIQWDVDSHDWMNKGVDYEINQVLNHKHLGNGSIILFHNDARDTPKALPVILKGLKEKGYEIVLISDLIHKDNFYMDHEGRQKLNDTTTTTQ